MCAPRSQERVQRRRVRLGRTVRRMDAPIEPPMGEDALLAKHCFASARTHSRQRLGRTAERGLRRVLHGHALRPPT